MKKATILSAIILIGIISSCGNNNATAPQNGATPPLSLKVERLAPKSITVYSQFSATLEGKQNVEIWPKMGGFIQNIYVEEGQKVKKGQLLFQLETSTLNQDANTAKATINLAQVEVDKLVPLVEKGIISNVQLETAKAQLAQAKSSYASIVSNINYSRITSPVDGYIGEIPYKTGTLVSSTMPNPLTTVADASEIRAYFSLSEKELLAIKKLIPLDSKNQMNLDKAPEVKLEMVNGEEYPESGKITLINAIINSKTGSVTARADFNNAANILNSGGSGKIKIPSTYENVYEIPQMATIDLQGKKLIYVLNKDNTVSTKPIEIIAQTQMGYLVKDGIEPGTTIITEGVTKLKEGMTISPVN